MVEVVVIGAVEIRMIAVNYPTYSAILKARKKKYAEKIISLSNELLHENA